MRGLQQSPHAREKASKTDRYEKKSGSGEDNTKKTTKIRAQAKEDADTETGDPFVSSEHSEKHQGRVWRIVRDGVNRIPALAPRSVLSSRRTRCAHGVRSARLQNGKDIACSVRGADLPYRIPLKNKRFSARLFDS